MKPQPLRLTLSEQFLASARDMGDPAMIECALRVFRAIRAPRTVPMADADRAMFIEWQNQ